MINFKRGLTVAVSVGGMFGHLGVALADPDCIGHYVERNRVYAEAHYCFQSKEALTYFSNKGCIPGPPHLTPAQRRRIEDIQREERRDNCRTQ